MRKTSMWLLKYNVKILYYLFLIQNISVSIKHIYFKILNIKRIPLKLLL